MPIDAALTEWLYLTAEVLPPGVVVFFASYAIWVMGAALLLALYRRREAYGAFALIAGSVLAAYGANTGIGFFVLRSRPFVSGMVEPYINTAHLGGSFPSDHAAVAWALACAYALLPRTKNAWLFFCLAFLVSIGRVAAGVHFASDIAFGAAVGVVAAWLVRGIARHLRARYFFAVT